MSIKPKVKVSSGQRQRNGQAILDGAKPLIRKEAERLGVMMVDEGTQIIGAEFITDRPPRRRRSSDIRLINALKYEVVESGDVITSVLTTKRGVNTKKVATMNNGSRAHDIVPRNGMWLRFPAPRTGGTGRAGAIRNAYGGAPFTKAKRVRHPGRSRTARGTKFMQRARARALARLR
jgi:hypothetical protein